MLLFLLSSLAVAADPPTATAKLEPRSGSKVTGTVTLTEQPDKQLKVVIELSGASPGEHAVHVHEKGDCSAPDAASAGSHFNPQGHQHGLPEAPVHHPGDFGNVAVGPDGKGRKELLTKDITLADGPTKVRGLAVIVHEKKDDGSQPVGNAGGRQACGVIQ